MLCEMMSGSEAKLGLCAKGNGHTKKPLLGDEEDYICELQALMSTWLFLQHCPQPKSWGHHLALYRLQPKELHRNCTLTLMTIAAGSEFPSMQRGN